MHESMELVRLAEAHLGERYQNVLVPKDNPAWRGPWDCAEFATWLVFQSTGKLYGCTDNLSSPSIADAYSGAWVRDVQQGALHSVGFEQAVGAPGVILIRRPPTPGTMGHIAVSDGHGRTIEAAGVGLGVRRGNVQGRIWHYFAAVPELTYPEPREDSPRRPDPFVLELTDPNMSGPLVRQVQEALQVRGYNPGVIDGEYGPHTVAAVIAFQTASRLIADGMVGPKTARRLGLQWPDAMPS